MTLVPCALGPWLLQSTYSAWCLDATLHGHGPNVARWLDPQEANELLEQSNETHLASRVVCTTNVGRTSWA